MLEKVQRAGDGGRYVHAELKVAVRCPEELVSRLMPVRSSYVELSRGLAGLRVLRGLPSPGLGPSVFSTLMVLQIK